MCGSPYCVTLLREANRKFGVRVNALNALKNGRGRKPGWTRKLTHAQAKTPSAWHQKASADEVGRRWPHGQPTRRTGKKKLLEVRGPPKKREHATENQDRARNKKGFKGSRIPEVPFTAASTTTVTHDRERVVQSVAYLRTYPR